LDREVEDPAHVARGGGLQGQKMLHEGSGWA
jgi:hypothetical protein